MRISPRVLKPAVSDEDLPDLPPPLVVLRDGICEAQQHLAPLSCEPDDDGDDRRREKVNDRAQRETNWVWSEVQFEDLPAWAIRDLEAGLQ